MNREILLLAIVLVAALLFVFIEPATNTGLATAIAGQTEYGEQSSVYKLAILLAVLAIIAFWCCSRYIKNIRKPVS